MIDRLHGEPYVSLWECRAEGILEQAIGLVRDRRDAIGTVEAALMALRIEASEAEPAELDGYQFAGEPEPEPDEDSCICPADLLARGGHRGGCPVHA